MDFQHKTLVKKAKSRLQLSHNKANIEYWNHLHTRKIPFPDMDFPITIKKHTHSDTLLHLRRHHVQHDEFIGKAKSQINTCLSKRVIDEKSKKDRYRQYMVDRSSGKSQSARGKRSNQHDLKLRRKAPQYSVFKKKQNQLYTSHLLDEKESSIKLQINNKRRKSKTTKLSQTKRQQFLSDENYMHHLVTINRSSPLIGCLSRADLQAVLNKREFSPIQKKKRPQSAPSHKRRQPIMKTRKIVPNAANENENKSSVVTVGLKCNSSIVKTIDSGNSSVVTKTSNHKQDKVITINGRKGGTVLLPLSPSVQSTMKKVRRNLTRIVAEDIADRDASEYNGLLGYLKNMNLEELARQEIKEDAIDYMMSQRQ